MNLKLGDVQTTALIPLAIKANETKRKNARITDNKAAEIIDALGVDTAQYDKFMSGTDSGQEIADLVPGFRLTQEHSFNEEMRKYSIRAKIFATLLPKFNDRWATFEW